MLNKIKNIIISILIIGVIISIFLFGRSCGKNSVKIPQYKDSIIVKNDTIWPDTMKIETPKPYPVHDKVELIKEVPIPTDTQAILDQFKLRHYTRHYRDKDIEVIVDDTILGTLIAQKASYRLFKPTSIYNSTVTTVKPQDTVKVPKKWELRGGIDITPKNLYFGLDFQKRRVSYSLGYDPFNKQVKGGLKFTILTK